MALKLSVGLQKKVGLPDFGSLGASCHVEFEIDGSLLHHDLDGFHEQVRSAFVACQQAVTDQLARQHPPEPGITPQGHSRQDGLASGRDPMTNGITPAGRIQGRNGTAPRTRSPGRSATTSQVRAIRAIADRQGIALRDHLSHRFGVQRPEDLTLADASALIDELKASPAGSGGGR